MLNLEPKLIFIKKSYHKKVQRLLTQELQFFSYMGRPQNRLSLLFFFAFLRGSALTETKISSRHTKKINISFKISREQAPQLKRLNSYKFTRASTSEFSRRFKFNLTRSLEEEYSVCVILDCVLWQVTTICKAIIMAKVWN